MVRKKGKKRRNFSTYNQLLAEPVQKSDYEDERVEILVRDRGETRGLKEGDKTTNKATDKES